MKSNSDHKEKTPILRKFLMEFLLVILITCVLFFFSFPFHRHLGILFIYIPFGYLIYAINNYYLLERIYKQKISDVEYLLLVMLASIVIFLPFGSFVKVVHGRYSDKILILGAIVTVIIVPLTYYYFFRFKKNKQTISNLQKDLGQTSAEFKLMQSQVNPHFLFNVMNSIYGIALQEDAPRTADSVQRLSQMMRFMIFENQQDQIPLSRDLNYLKEYIAIQSLRTESVESIKIEQDIINSLDNLFITPMLLIPFVENAFKHGISMSKPSWIKVNADVVDKQLKFSVYNSIHKIQGTDLERTKSGIGLENVKTRLDLTYPDRYMLVMEQNQQEYFVFLTIDLDDGKRDVDIKEENDL